MSLPASGWDQRTGTLVAQHCMSLKSVSAQTFQAMPPVKGRSVPSCAWANAVVAAVVNKAAAAVV
ncbi:hypothetical protein [Streptomyces cirratus]|uniref:hypothetical protein n=1 Tax=Streptomyces cirratus TaxID=68187 RepID=UPI00167EDCE1|nr:hypothetical protein [Streptomyces cirratus]